MQQFKVGDWVRDTRQGMKKPIAQLKPNCIALTNPEEYAMHYIPWVPEVGEWCWFWDDITPYRPTLRKFGCSELPNYLLEEYYLRNKDKDRKCQILQKNF